PLHYGWRRGHGLRGGLALLVAEDYRQALSESVVAICRRGSLHRLQSDVLSAIYSWLPRHAPALSHLSAGIPGAQRAFDRRRLDSCTGLPAAHELPDLVHALWPSRRTESVHRTGRLYGQFETLEQQKETAALGMWVFLVTEVLFFGGLFLAYTVNRSAFSTAFGAGSNTLDIKLGGFNTVVLIMSSLTMAMA